MKKLITLLVTVLAGIHLQAQITEENQQWLQRNIPSRSKGTPVTSSWHTGTAGIIKSDGAELSLFNPSRVGMTKNTELLFRIGEEWILPNVGFKHRWWGNDRFILSTEHSLYYTWPLFKILQSTGIKDLIPDSVRINQGIAMRNELLFSWLMNPQVAGCPDPMPERILTFRAGVEFYAGAGKNEIVPFDWFHSLYHTQILNKKLLYYGGFQFDSYFSNRFHYSANALYYSVDFSKSYAVEGNVRFTYYVSKRVGLSACCKLAYMDITQHLRIPGNLEGTIIPTDIRDKKSQFTFLPFLDVTLLIHPDRGEIRHGLFKNRKKMR